MTNIPSVEEVKKMGLQKKQGQVTVYCYTQTQLENILINQRTALLTELREWVDENLTTCDSYNNTRVYQMVDPDDLKAHLDELIKSNNV